jgi:hypothetical protein
VLEETYRHAQTFARKFRVSDRFQIFPGGPPRTFPLSGWPKFGLSPALRPKASRLNNSGPHDWAKLEG